MAQLTPNSVRQLLMVLERTARNVRAEVSLSRAYQDAVRYVADRHGVTYQTIGDLCRRRLGLSDVDEFLELLREWLEGEGEGLRRRLKKHAQAGSHPIINEFFATSPEPSGDSRQPGAVPLDDGRLRTTGDSLKVSVMLPPELAQRVRLAQVAGLGATIEETVTVLLEAGFEARLEGVREALDEVVRAR